MQPLDAALLRKVTWRLVPFMMFVYFVNYLDRVNVGFAALTMNQDLGFSPNVYGTGAGILFLGHVVLQIPSNLALERIGVRPWIASMTVAWGLVSSAMALVSGSTSFYVFRFLLGIAEAGFFPGMILYLTYWFPRADRARITALFMMAIPVSSVLGAPFSTVLLGMSGFGLKGWQWLFVLQGAPAVILGIVAFFFLTESPAAAAWLSAAEREALTAKLAGESGPRSDAIGIGRTLASPKLWLFGVIYFGAAIGLYGLTLWLPQIIKGFGGLSNIQVGLLTSVPFALSALSMYLWNAHGDATGERIWHLIVPLSVGALAMVASAVLIDRPVAAFIALIVAAVGLYTALPAFWSFPNAALDGRGKAVAIALIIAIGNIGGYAGPKIVGVVMEATRSYAGGLGALAACAVVSTMLAIALKPRPVKRAIGA